MALSGWLRLRGWFGPSPYPAPDDWPPLAPECEPRPTPLELLETHGSVAVAVHAREGCLRCKQRVAELRARD